MPGSEIANLYFPFSGFEVEIDVLPQVTESRVVSVSKKSILTFTVEFFLIQSPTLISVLPIVYVIFAISPKSE